MGADIKSLRTRIKSVDSTMHLTKAMGLVASSKIRRATLNMNQSREYAAAVQATIDTLRACSDCKSSPYMVDRTEGGQPIRTAYVIIAGDRGLAGGYNANIFRLARTLLDENATVFAIGKRAYDRYGDGYISAEHFTYAQAIELARKLCDGFAAGELDRVEIVWTQYVSMLTQTATRTPLLPLVPAEKSQQGEKTTDVVFEPDELTILNLAIQEYVAGMLVACVRESFASEVAARRCAMDSAGKNAQQMIDDLQLQYNRARQGAITQELTEIVAGANA